MLEFFEKHALNILIDANLLKVPPIQCFHLHTKDLRK